MKELWIEINKVMPLELKKDLLQEARGLCSVVLTDEVDPLFQTYGMRVASRDRGDISLIDEAQIDGIKDCTHPLCLRLVVKNRKDEEQAMKVAEKGVTYIIIRCPNWKIIPFENLIAKIHGRSKIIAEVSSSDEAQVALETLELGVDGILLKTEDSAEIKATRKVIELLDIKDGIENRIPLTLAKIVSCAQLSMGARVCIDTCDIMVGGEGMLIGSSSSGLFLIQAEVQKNPHVEPRPIRVNAGPISLYVLAPNNNTRYLSELKSGDEVLTVDREGKSRTTIIGRIKIERRPLILIEAEVNGNLIKTIVQNAETIHVVTKDGSKSVVDLKPGDEVLVAIQQGGRHFGTLVKEEMVIEK